MKPLIIAPQLDRDGIPYCSATCPAHDGKRCRIRGLQLGSICEPYVGNMAAMERAKIAEQLEQNDGIGSGKEAADFVRRM